MDNDPNFSILADLLGPDRDDRPQATSLIRLLLNSIANDAIDAHTDVLTSYFFVKFAREWCDIIEDGFRKVPEIDNEDEALELLEECDESIAELEG